LLACAAEGLSASRFAEYLSLGQLPEPGQPHAVWIASDDEVFGPARSVAPEETPEPETAVDDAEERAVLAGSLRTPRRWERMLGEAAVVGGDPARWRRRLIGFDEELRLRRAEIEREDPSSARLTAIDEDRTRLEHLGAFALPIVTEMAAWPALARWGEWLDRLDDLAPPHPSRSRVLCDECSQTFARWPRWDRFSIDEVRRVLTERLRSVDGEPPARRYGRVFVGSPAQARGRSFRVVFVPGLAERMFPAKIRSGPAHAGRGARAGRTCARHPLRAIAS
jgi:hypothetical protein